MATPTQNRKYHDPETGELVLPEDWSRYFDWFFAEPRMPRTIAEWAVQNDYHPDTVVRWKKDPEFLRMWDERANAVNISTERVQDVVEALYRKAKGGDTKAASLYLQYIERFTPKKAITVESAATESLSDLELEQLLRQELGS